MAHDLRELLRLAEGKGAQPTVALVDSQTLRSTVEFPLETSRPESGDRAGCDAGKKTKGSKGHIAVDTLGNLLALTVTPTHEQDRTQVGALAEQIQAVTGGTVTQIFADGGYTGIDPAQAAREAGMELAVVKRSDLAQGFVVLPKRWVVERSFAWKSRFRRLVRDYERLPETVAGLHFVAFVILMLTRLLATKATGA